MRRTKRAIQEFMNLESSSSIILFFVSVFAIVWANSSYGFLYEKLWNHQFTIGFTNSSFYLSKSLILWINDGLMAIFFFVIGLEVKREILAGELTTIKKASLPFFAAIGGMLFPVIIFIYLNYSKTGSDGWGIPMATDIAFTLGILKLLGNRVPLGLKIFLTAFAIVDDIGAVLVIAIFYSANIQWNLIFYAVVLVGVLGLFSYKQYYSKYIFFVSGFIVWLLFLKSGIHPTIAGILMAFVIPIKRKGDLLDYFKTVTKEMELFKVEKSHENKLMNDKQMDAITIISKASEKVYSPLQSLEHSLHGWVSFIIMPIFALANAGVVLNFNGMENTQHITWNIALGLVLGNSIGIMFLSVLGIKLKLASLPKGVNYLQLLGVSFLGGLGFTMSLFIANLAYTNEELIVASKMGIIIGSVIAGIFGYIILRLSLKDQKRP